MQPNLAPSPNVQDSHPYVAIGKISAETRRLFVALVMPLSVQILFRPTIADLAIAMRLRSSVEQPLLVVISDPRKFNCVTCSTSVPSTIIGSSFPSLPTIMILVLLTFSRRPRASLLAFTISSSSFNSNALVATRVVSSAYRRLLSLERPPFQFSRTRLIMYSAYRLKSVGDKIQPCLTPWPILNQSESPFSVRTQACWLSYKLLINFTKCVGTPISSRAFHSALCLTQSKALA